MGRPERQRSNSGGIERRVGAPLAAYAAGTLWEPFAVLVASHLQMKAANLPYDLSKSYERWSSPMSAIDQMNELLLRSYVSRHLSGLAWRMFLPGIKQCRIAQDMRGDASF